VLKSWPKAGEPKKKVHHRDTETQRRQQEGKEGKKDEGASVGWCGFCPSASLLVFFVSLCLCGEPLFLLLAGV
jgi:hypothetical protein